MGDFQRQVAGSRPLLAARAAINASSTALDACSAPPNAASRLARIDLCGMAGWLRAHGVSMDYPRDVAESAQAISAALRGGGHAALANRLVADVAATLATSVSAHGDVRAANRLLACVDEVERVAH